MLTSCSLKEIALLLYGLLLVLVVLFTRMYICAHIITTPATCGSPWQVASLYVPTLLAKYRSLNEHNLLVNNIVTMS